MRKKDPELMEKISSFVGQYYRREQVSPTVRAIAEGLGIGKTTAHSYLVAMNEKKQISYDGRTVRTRETERCRSAYVSAPVIGSIRCGDPETEEEYIEEYVNLPQSIFGGGRLYVLKAAGDSMEDEGIGDGDLLVVRRQTDCEKGDVVVALDPQGENTLKTYGGTDPKTGDAILRYRNRAVYGNKVLRVKELSVQGVVKYVIKAV